jgi:hypothetical protein
MMNRVRLRMIRKAPVSVEPLPHRQGLALQRSGAAASANRGQG